MKKLLLALLVSGTAILAVGQPASVSSDCLQSSYIYYEYPGGPVCGSAYFFCDGSFQQNGCITPHYQYRPGCDCP